MNRVERNERQRRDQDQLFRNNGKRTPPWGNIGDGQNEEKALKNDVYKRLGLRQKMFWSFDFLYTAEEKGYASRRIEKRYSRLLPKLYILWMHRQIQEASICSFLPSSLRYAARLRADSHTMSVKYVILVIICDRQYCIAAMNKSYLLVSGDSIVRDKYTTRW